MAANRYPRKIPQNQDQIEDIELGNSKITLPYEQLSNNMCNSEPDYFTPIANGVHYPTQMEEEILSSGQDTQGSGFQQSRTTSQKTHNSQADHKIRKLIKQSSEVGLMFLEGSTGDQVPKKVSKFIKRGSVRLDEFIKKGSEWSDTLDRPNKVFPKQTEDREPEINNHPRIFMSDLTDNLTHSSPNIPETEQDDLNDTMVFSPSTITTTLSFVENKFEEGLLSPTGVPQPTMPSLLIPNDSTNRYRSSNSNLHIQDTISTSNSMSNLNNTLELPDRLKDAIAHNHCDMLLSLLEDYKEEYGSYDGIINYALWHACAHGAEKSAELLIEEFDGNPNYVYKNVPCIQLAARRGNVALLTLILDKHKSLVSNSMPKDALLTIDIPHDTEYSNYRLYDSMDNLSQPSRRNSSLGGRKQKEKMSGLRIRRKGPMLEPEEERKTSIMIHYTPLSTPLHQTTLTNDVSMTKVILEKYKVNKQGDIEAIDCHLKTALMYAAEEGSVDTLRYLLESDANIERKDAEGYTALLHAVKNGNRQCILLLLQKGSNENAKDNRGRGLFEIAKDETVCIYVAKLLLNDSLAVRLPLHGLVKRGYSHCFQLIVDNTIHYRGDCWEFDLKIFQMDDNGVLPENEYDYKEKKTSLLQLINSEENMDFVDCLPLRILVSHWLSKYGVWYILLKTLYFILNMAALSYFFLFAADSKNPFNLFNFNNVMNSIEVICLFIIMIGWLTHLIFEICEVVLRCRAKWNTIHTKYKETEGKISLLMDAQYLCKAILFGMFDYLKSSHNIIDIGIISSLPLFLIFWRDDSPIQWYFAAFLYFSRSLEIVKLLTVSPFGIYVHTIWTTLSGDLPKFIFIVAISLFSFSGTLFISLRAPSNDYYNQTLPVSEMAALRNNDNTYYWWLLLTSFRLLIEQGSVVKVDFITIFNWFAVIIFFLMLGWILLILRVIFIAHVSNTYAVSRNRAERYVTSYKLGFLLKMQENSLIALVFDLKKKFYNPTLEISRKEMRKYFESDGSYAQWNSTWVERVEEAKNARKKRNLQFKDNQLFELKGVGNPAESERNSLITESKAEPVGPDDGRMRSNSVILPSMEIMNLLVQSHNSMKSEINTLEENQQTIERATAITREEFNDRFEDLKYTILQEIAQLSSQLKQHIQMQNNK